jgi:hypothetical protein
LPEDILRSAPSIIACDNVEVSPNYQSEEYAEIIHTAYKTFFREYLSRFAEGGGFDSRRIVIGKGYSDALSELPQEPNTFVPRAPVGYSDKTHDTVHTLSLDRNNKTKFDVITRGVPAAVVEKRLSLDMPRGISPLSFEDSIGVAYIEGKAYKDNVSLLQYLWGMENMLIAKDISNSHKNRPDLSFKYESGGVLSGYFLAYEGAQTASRSTYMQEYDEEGEYEEYENQTTHTPTSDKGEAVIYIADFAVKKPGSIASARAANSLLDAFMERYKNEYLDKNNLIPIVAHAREQTSRRLMQRKLTVLAAQLGIAVDVEEGTPYEEGGDRMYKTTIRPRKL